MAVGAFRVPPFMNVRYYTLGLKVMGELGGNPVMDDLLGTESEAEVTRSPTILTCTLVTQWVKR